VLLDVTITALQCIEGELTLGNSGQTLRNTMRSIECPEANQICHRYEKRFEYSNGLGKKAVL